MRSERWSTWAISSSSSTTSTRGSRPTAFIQGQGYDRRSTRDKHSVSAASVLEPDAPVEPRGGVDVEDAHRLRRVVAEAVLHPRRDEHERAGRRGDNVVPEQERQLAVEDVEGVVLVVVDVRLELAAGGEVDDAEREARGVRGAREELDVADAPALAGCDDDGAGVHARDARARRGVCRRRGQAAAAAPGRAPSWAIRPSWSTTFQCSAMRPSATRTMSITAICTSRRSAGCRRTRPRAPRGRPSA